jgi:ElaB/YqjD/DUF883 family membrane-anchored ribosome-binding protein
MEDYIVKDVLEKIVAIDKKRRNIEKEMLEIKANHEEVLQRKMKQLQRQMMKETRIKAKKKIHTMNEKSDEEEKKILKKAEASVEMMDQNFEQKKDQCIAAIIENIFNKN